MTQPHTINTGFEMLKNHGKARRLRPATLRTYAEAHARWASVLTDSHPLAKIGREEVDRFLAAHAHLRSATVNRHLRTMNRLLRLAGLTYRCGLLKAARPRVTTITQAQLEDLLAASSRQLRPLIEFVATTGCRRLEAVDLRWRGLDLVGRVAHIGDAKSGEARAVPLPDRTLRSLQLLAARGAAPDLPVFRPRVSSPKPWHPNALSNAVRQVFIDANLGHVERSGLHALRRSFATWLNASGVGLATVMALGGWRQASTVLHLYTSVPDSTARAAVEAVFPSSRRSVAGGAPV